MGITWGLLYSQVWLIVIRRKSNVTQTVGFTTWIYQGVINQNKEDTWWWCVISLFWLRTMNTSYQIHKKQGVLGSPCFTGREHHCLFLICKDTIDTFFHGEPLSNGDAICTYLYLYILLQMVFSWIKTQQRFGACIKGSDGVYHQRPMVGFVGCHRHIILQAESLSGRKASRFQNRAEKRHCATLGDFSMTCFLQWCSMK